MTELAEVVAYLDEYLDISRVPDSERAFNGLQVENAGKVTKVAAGVDASEATIVAARAAGVDLLLVHHGLFWGGGAPMTGARYRRTRELVEAGIAVYSAHAPLDVHSELGNNALLAEAIGLKTEGGFASVDGFSFGIWGRLEIRREALAARLDEVLGGPVKLIPGGPERLERVGVITGGAGGMIADAVRAGLDAFVTGEGAHHTYFDAIDGGINVYYGGHYATEVWGVRALAAHLEARFDLPWTFLDFPTGL
ncbi:MAG: Nif3-like dinuclear metal center hexameric protein [Planctomycetaceae bacterium]